MGGDTAMFGDIVTDGININSVSKRIPTMHCTFRVLFYLFCTPESLFGGMSI
jgi:hypothetical protein